MPSIPSLTPLRSAAIACVLAVAPFAAAPAATACEAHAEPLMAMAPDHTAAWDALLARYATADGGFRYAALRDHTEDVATLARLVEAVGSASIDGYSTAERLAFWMNAYNILTVHSVLELWPVESVLAEDGFFDGRTFTIAGETLTLNGLENDRIRTLGEPRIHFLVNCASTSCPPLALDALTPSNLESLLASQARAYVTGTSVLDRAANTVTISQIFEWFAGDFEAGGGVRAFIASQFSGDEAAFILNPATTIAYTPYDWSLNGR